MAEAAFTSLLEKLDKVGDSDALVAKNILNSMLLLASRCDSQVKGSLSLIAGCLKNHADITVALRKCQKARDVDKAWNKTATDMESALMSALHRFHKVVGSVKIKDDDEGTTTEDGKGKGDDDSKGPAIPKEKLERMRNLSNEAQEFINQNAASTKAQTDKNLTVLSDAIKPWIGGLPDGKKWAEGVQDQGPFECHEWEWEWLIHLFFAATPCDFYTQRVTFIV